MRRSTRPLMLVLVPTALAALAIAMGGCSDALTDANTVVPGGLGGAVRFEIATTRTGGNFKIVGQEVTDGNEFQIVTSSAAACPGEFAVANNVPQPCNATVKAVNPGTHAKAFLKTKWEHVGKGEQVTFAGIEAP